MARNNRCDLIKQISQLRNSAVICYITGDRENISTRIAPDVIRFFHRHLELMGPQPQIDLFLYTRGGDILTPWRLVNLIREYTSNLSVLVPFRSYSAGTLICLGANEIVMTKMAELGPIDPTVINVFNPSDRNNPGLKLPVSVEDVHSFFALAKSKCEPANTQEMLQVFKTLADKVHPLALGNVHRNHALIRSISKKLLTLHTPIEKEAWVNNVVDHLTERLHAHNHMISRGEAVVDLGLNITKPNATLEGLLWSLYESYEEDLQLLQPFFPSNNVNQQPEFEVYGGFLESLSALDAFTFYGTVECNQNHVRKPHAVNILQQGWKKLI